MQSRNSTATQFTKLRDERKPDVMKPGVNGATPRTMTIWIGFASNKHVQRLPVTKGSREQLVDGKRIELIRPRRL